MGIKATFAASIFAVCVLWGCSSSAPVAQLPDSRAEAIKELETRGTSRTPDEFVKAIRSGEDQLVVLFLKAGMDPNLRTSNRGLLDLTPLHWALMTDHSAIAKTLLDYGADPMIWATNPPSPAFHLTISRSKDLALRIIESGVPIDVPDGVGRTPLFYAARDDNLDIARVLIDKGANINTKDVIGATILIGALRNGQPEAAKLLLEKGASIEEGGYSPLVLAAERGYRDIAKILLARGADFRRPSLSGDTALRAATRNGHRELAEFLIELGADVNQGQPILGAAFRNDLEMVKLLLGKGADVNAIDKTGRSALRMVARDEYEEMMRLLLAHGANVNLPTIYGETSLMLAAESGHEKTIRLLLAHGADIHAKDKNGKTAFDYAKGRPHVRQLLIDHGARP